MSTMSEQGGMQVQIFPPVPCEQLLQHSRHVETEVLDTHVSTAVVRKDERIPVILLVTCSQKKNISEYLSRLMSTFLRREHQVFGHNCVGPAEQIFDHSAAAVRCTFILATYIAARWR